MNRIELVDQWRPRIEFWRGCCKIRPLLPIVFNLFLCYLHVWHWPATTANGDLLKISDTNANNQGLAVNVLGRELITGKLANRGKQSVSFNVLYFPCSTVMIRGRWFIVGYSCDFWDCGWSLHRDRNDTQMIRHDNESIYGLCAFFCQSLNCYISAKSTNGGVLKVEDTATGNPNPAVEIVGRGQMTGEPIGKRQYIGRQTDTYIERYLDRQIHGEPGKQRCWTGTDFNIIR